jgi:hypothetical protein
MKLNVFLNSAVGNSAGYGNFGIHIGKNISTQEEDYYTVGKNEE